jgi:hypothetical protein
MEGHYSMLFDIYDLELSKLTPNLVSARIVRPGGSLMLSSGGTAA